MICDAATFGQDWKLWVDENNNFKISYTDRHNSVDSFDFTFVPPCRVKKED